MKRRFFFRSLFALSGLSLLNPTLFKPKPMVATRYGRMILHLRPSPEDWPTVDLAPQGVLPPDADVTVSG